MHGAVGVKNDKVESCSYLQVILSSRGEFDDHFSVWLGTCAFSVDTLDTL
jgi:hypothetical protein